MSVRPRDKWQSADSGAHYAQRRWSGRGALIRAQRDPRMVARLLDRHGVRSGTVLDAACGTGRLSEAIGGHGRRWVGLDASESMLRQLRGDAPGRPVVRAVVEALPFAAKAFDAVVACRLLHHYHDPAELSRALRELLRVSRGPVVASFWNRASAPGLRRRLGLSRGEGEHGRVARSVAELRAAAELAGGRCLEVRHVLPWLSQQSFAVLVGAGS